MYLNVTESSVGIPKETSTSNTFLFQHITNIYRKSAGLQVCKSAGLQVYSLHLLHTDICVLPRGTNMAAGNRKKTSGVHFCQKRGLFSLVNFRKFRQMFLLILALFRMLKISGRVILKSGTALPQQSS